MRVKLLTVFFVFSALFFVASSNSPSFTKKTEKNAEKIYAVMITGKDLFHKALAERSIESFLQQTYPNKHLIIVNDGDYSFGNLNSDIITEIKLDKKYVLGALRNIGFQHIPEDAIYIQWDDDDWHHPELMEKQYKYMTARRADGCILRHEVVYCFKNNIAWISAPRAGVMGTIMCKRKSNVFYPELIKSEDNVFLKEYKKKYKLVVWRNPAYYYLRFVHGHNTWDEQHFRLNRFTDNEWRISGADAKYLVKIVPSYLFLK